jgi:microcystin-dependent protein
MAYNSNVDFEANFTAPAGQSVQALVKGPAGLASGAPCPGSQCYVMRAIHAGETPDAYFPAAVAAALAAQAHKLVIPQGTYNFRGPSVSADSSNANTCNEGHYWNCTPHWTIGSYPSAPMTTPTGVLDLDIDLSGSVLNFAAPTTGIWILNAARVRLENFTIDWPNLRIASLGTIVPDPKNPGHQALVLDDAYTAADPLTGGYVQIQAVDVWDDSTDPAGAPGRFDLSAGNAHEVYFTFGGSQPTFIGRTGAGQTFSCESCNFSNGAGSSSCSMFAGCANFDLFATGTRVVVRHYTYNGFALLMNWSDDIDLENVKILTSPGMGIAVNEAGGFRGFRFANSSISRGSGRLISTASDAINITQFAGDIIIDSNEVAFQGDDGINVSPSAQAIASASSGVIGVTGACTPNSRDAVVAGDTLAFFDGSSNFLGTAGTSAATGSTCGNPGVLSVSLDCAGSSACAAMVGALSPADSFVDVTQQPVARYAVRNNHFHENRGHGTVAGAPFGEVTGNTYFRNSMGAIDFTGLGSFGADNLLVSGNVTN